VVDTTAENRYRELDRRSSNGIDVRLLWDPASNRVSVAVDDGRGGRSFRLDVASDDALDAFHHPYAYAA
jgi:hypothetical protein